MKQNPNKKEFSELIQRNQAIIHKNYDDLYKRFGRPRRSVSGNLSAALKIVSQFSGRCKIQHMDV